MQIDTTILLIIIFICIIVGIIAAILKSKENQLEERIYQSNLHIKQDYEKVLRVLGSCKNEEQLMVAKKMMQCFIEKHKVNAEYCSSLCVVLNDTFITKYHDIQSIA